MLEKYAVVDIEATGGTQKVDRIIEIGIVLIDGEEIVSSFSSLVRPGISIPPFITKLTGISNQMVADSPKFHEIAKTIVEMTQGRPLVAHNVSFDYRILREEFDRLGYEFKSDTLCTARLSRHYFPGFAKYNLASVAKELGLDLTDRHRAGDDAMATAEVMLQILKKSRDAGLSLKNMSIYKSKSRLPDNIQEEQILDLPNVCGVYYMLDVDNEPLYIGKSIKVRSRIRAHFTEETSKTQKMQKLVHAIRYENTGSELMAEIHESLEIRKFKPLLNRAKRKTRFDNALIATTDGEYKSFKIKYKTKVKKEDDVLQWFSSKNAAKAYITGLVQNHELCACLCGVNTLSNDCMTYKIGHCLGAQLRHEDHATYNERYADAYAMSNRLFSQRMLVLDRGRTKEEFSAFYISDNRVSHIGYLSQNTVFSMDEKELSALLNPISHNAEIDRILYRYFYLRKYEKMIEYSAVEKVAENNK